MTEILSKCAADLSAETDEQPEKISTKAVLAATSSNAERRADGAARARRGGRDNNPRMFAKLIGETPHWQYGQSTALVQVVLPVRGGRKSNDMKHQAKYYQEIKQHPPRKVSSLS